MLLSGDVQREGEGLGASGTGVGSATTRCSLHPPSRCSMCLAAAPITVLWHLLQQTYSDSSNFSMTAGALMIWLTSNGCDWTQQGQVGGSSVVVCCTHAHTHDVQHSTPHGSWSGLSNTPRQRQHSTSLNVNGELGGTMNSIASCVMRLGGGPS